MHLRFHAFIEKGEKYLIASCAEAPEAIGQGLTKEECLSDLEASIQSVLEYRQAEAKARMPMRSKWNSKSHEATRTDSPSGIEWMLLRARFWPSVDI